MHRIAPLLAVLFIFIAIDARADFINGSFETTVPVVAPGTFHLFSAGDPGVSGWTVLGPGANIAVVNTSFTQSGLSFVAQSGANWVDLTGLDANASEGLSQTVATTVGNSYTLTFWIGNVNSAATGFGVTSTVLVFADVSPLGSFTNSC